MYHSRVISMNCSLEDRCAYMFNMLFLMKNEYAKMTHKFLVVFFSIYIMNTPLTLTYIWTD